MPSVVRGIEKQLTAIEFYVDQHNAQPEPSALLSPVLVTNITVAEDFHQPAKFATAIQPHAMP